MEENAGSGKRGEQKRYEISIHYSIGSGTTSLLNHGYSMRGVCA
jgi:hypothetical protein